MMERDQRSFRVALVADAFVNPSSAGWDAMPVLLDRGWGVIQLPADDYPDAVAMPLLEQVAEQAEEFHRRGYDLVVIGRRAGLSEALASVRMPQPDGIDPASATQLGDFLSSRPLPRAAFEAKPT